MEKKVERKREREICKESQPLVVHQWIRSAIHASQQLTLAIVFYLWSFRHRCAVLMVSQLTSTCLFYLRGLGDIETYGLWRCQKNCSWTLPASNALVNNLCLVKHLKIAVFVVFFCCILANDLLDAQLLPALNHLKIFLIEVKEIRSMLGEGLKESKDCGTGLTLWILSTSHLWNVFARSCSV